MRDWRVADGKGEVAGSGEAGAVLAGGGAGVLRDGVFSEAESWRRV
jgi:hypothetical protein